MSAGAVAKVLICTPVQSADLTNSVDQQVCPSLDGQNFHLQSQLAYVLAPESAGYIDSIAQPFDYAAAAGFWGLAFTTIISLWLVSHGAGALVNFLRRA